MTDADGASALGGAIDGVLAEYVVIDEAGLVAIPAYMDFAQAATLPCAAVTTWNALYGREPIAPGSTVMALGTGGVAIWTLQLAKAAGARVAITSSSDAKLERATAMGADHVVNYAATPKWGAAARAFTGGRGIDKIVDSAGPSTMPQSLSALRRGGDRHGRRHRPRYDRPAGDPHRRGAGARRHGRFAPPFRRSRPRTGSAPDRTADRPQLRLRRGGRGL
ncbi:NAD(P)-dependent alcohol dehydrogenase [Novosphingobium resinovorum]